MSARTPKPLFPWRKPPSPPPDPTPLQIGEKLVDAVNSAASTVAALSAPKPPSPPPDPTPFQNAEKLVEAVNTAASTVAALHVAFMALSAYLAVTVWGATHVDFLKESPVKLPLIDVQVDLTSFYGVAPWLYVLVHLNLLIQFYLLARKVWAFAAATEYPQLADRLFVFPFVHYLLHRAGRFVRPLLALAVFASVIAVPLFVLLYVQIKFLAYHSEVITWSQRLAVWADAGLLLWMWPRVASRSGRYRDGFRPERCRHKIVAPWLASSMMAVVAMGSCLLALVALVPAAVSDLNSKTLAPDQYEEADGFEARLVRWLDNSCACKLLVLKWWADSSRIPRQFTSPCVKIGRGSPEVAGRLGPTLWITAWLFDPQTPIASAHPGLAEEKHLPSRLWRWVGDFLPKRYLDLHGEILLKEAAAAEVLHGLKDDVPDDIDIGGVDGKRLQSCQKPDGTRSDRFECIAVLGDWLRKIVPLKLGNRDLRGADLRGAVLPVSDLSKIQLQGAFLDWAQLQGARLDEAKLQDASLMEVQMQKASLNRAWLQGANLESARLQGVSLESARMQGAKLESAWLQGASLNGAQLQGASLNDAQLQGASLNGAQLQGASLSSVQLQGASFDDAQLQGARLDDVQLQGASLIGVHLYGARLNNTNLNAAVLFKVALNGSNGQAGSAVAAMVFDLDDAPLGAQRLDGIIDGIRPFLSGSEERLADFERRLKLAGQSDGGMVRLGSHDCYGSGKIGCLTSDVAERFMNEKYLPVLVDLVCGGSPDGFTVDAGKGVLRRLVVGKVDWKQAEWLDNPDLASWLKRSEPTVYLALRLLEALNAKRCPAVESMPEDLKEHLRKAAALAEQVKLLELRMLPDP